MNDVRPPVRLVVDTNVLVSGLISPDGPPARILTAVRQGHCGLVMSVQMMDELLRVLEYPRLQRYLSRVPGVMEAVAAFLLVHVERVEPEVAYDLSTDPDDNVFIDVAVSGKVDALVTGDKGHLLSLKEVSGIPVISARECIQRFA